MKKTIIIVFLFLILFCASPSVNAWVPPAGCVADSWVMVKNMSNNYSDIVFFVNNVAVCSYSIGGSSGYEMTTAGKVDTNEMSTTVSFFAGLLALTAFIAGVNGGKQL